LRQRRNFSPRAWCGIIKLCIACLQCLHICPTEAISETDDGLVVDEKCWRCGRCERVCPEGNIQLEKRGEDEFQAALAEGTQAVLSTFEPGYAQPSQG
jgi:Fe-S-cluster-containing hydrogenase component 2